MKRFTKDPNALIAILSGVLAALLCFIIRIRNDDVGDFFWPLQTARELWHLRDPYNFIPDRDNIPYPLPVALFGWPGLFLPWKLVAALFTGASTGLLIFGILRSGEKWRLWVLGGLPFFTALHFSQWSPLVMASWFFPALAPTLFIIKPQISLPVVLLRWSWRGALVAAVILLLSLVIYPLWPIRWLEMIGRYDRLIPVLTFPFGPLLLLAALRCRDDKRAWLLLIMSILPFRNAYDLCLLWLIPGNRQQAASLAFLSWILLPMMPSISKPAPPVAVPLLFLPCLCFLLWPMLLKLSKSRSTDIYPSP